MGRIATFKYLSPEQHVAADACIRLHRYSQIAVIREKLLDQGIAISRSALGRYMHKLGQQDGLLMDTTDATVVTIVDRASGHVAVLKTALNWSALAAHIESLAQKVKVS
ncbi:MAG: hypothetical protein Q8S02_04335 [Hydrogenophaga sp.]|nr:hypothetical protein [Hydrogenophaga sp.]